MIIHKTKGVNKMKPQLIVTMPPYAPFMKEVLKHKSVAGIRLNTVMPLTDSIDEVVKRMFNETKDQSKTLWVDLKGRQLRVADYGVPPFTEIRLTHSIKVNTPVTAYFSDGQETATVLKVDGNRLIMQEGPKRVIGPGESVNIPHPSLVIDGYLTDTDKRYVEAGVKNNTHDYMLSFVESSKDKNSLMGLDPKAQVVEKIESVRGLEYVNHDWKKSSRLMTARGDLYVELPRPHDIIKASEHIVKADPDAIVASRIFPSLSRSLVPENSDISDVDNLLRMGYRTFMLGDDVCMRRETVLSALNLFYEMTERYS